MYSMNDSVNGKIGNRFVEEPTKIFYSNVVGYMWLTNLKYFLHFSNINDFNL